VGESGQHELVRPPSPAARPRPSSPPPPLADTYGSSNDGKDGVGRRGSAVQPPSLWVSGSGGSGEGGSPLAPSSKRQRLRVRGAWSVVVRRLDGIARSQWFDGVILGFILANCVTLAMDNPLDPAGTPKARFLAMTEKVGLGLQPLGAKQHVALPSRCGTAPRPRLPSVCWPLSPLPSSCSSSISDMRPGPLAWVCDLRAHVGGNVWGGGG
jgi:hypothetical protein